MFIWQLLKADPALQEKADKMANEMIQLLTQIENDRLKYTEKRDMLRKTKDRMEKVTHIDVHSSQCSAAIHYCCYQVEIEITDERAELVTTAGLLNQNDKIREQIQQEEREKMRVRFLVL